MTSKELIEKLQKYPEDTDVVFRDMDNVSNCPIDRVEWMEGYWDGTKQKLIYDTSGKYPQIIGGKYEGGGMKIVLNGYSIEDLLYDYPDMPVEMPFSLKDAEWMGSLEEVYNRNQSFYSQTERWRKESKEIWD